MGKAKNSPQNISIIRRILAEEGFSPMAIAATLGRFGAESRFDPRAFNPKDGADGSDSEGINQWNAGRKRALKKFARSQGTDIYDIETQARFYAKEAKGELDGRAEFGGAISDESKYGRRLLSAQTPEEAAEATISLARPGGWKASNPRAGLGFRQTLADTKRFASGDFSFKGGKGKTLTGADAAPWITPNDRGLMPGSKSRGRSIEEGEEPLEVPDLESFGMGLSQPLEPIDESPGGKISQALVGLLGIAGKFQEDSAKKNPGGNIFSSKTLSSSESVPDSPSAHSIVAMIQNMGR